MYLRLNEKMGYDVPTNLGVAYELETKYKKKINKILVEAEDYTIEQMCKIMFVAIARKDKSAKFDEFFDNILNSGLSIIDIQKEFGVFLRLLVSNDKTEDEIRAEIEKDIEEEVNNQEQNIPETLDEKN